MSHPHVHFRPSTVAPGRPIDWNGMFRYPWLLQHLLNVSKWNQTIVLVVQGAWTSVRSIKSSEWVLSLLLLMLVFGFDLSAILLLLFVLGVTVSCLLQEVYVLTDWGYFWYFSQSRSSLQLKSTFFRINQFLS